MSLKVFHIVFVVVSTMLTLGFGAWAVGEYRHAGDASALWCGITSFAAAFALLVYGRWFLKKLKGISYL